MPSDRVDYQRALEPTGELGMPRDPSELTRAWREAAASVEPALADRPEVLASVDRAHDAVSEDRRHRFIPLWIKFPERPWVKAQRKAHRAHPWNLRELRGGARKVFPVVPSHGRNEHSTHSLRNLRAGAEPPFSRLPAEKQRFVHVAVEKVHSHGSVGAFDALHLVG